MKKLPLSELIEEIIETHHKFLREELPSLLDLLEKVITQEGSNFPKLHDLKKVFVAFFIDVNAHLTREENILFPLIFRAHTQKLTAHVAQLRNLIAIMEEEHDKIDQEIDQMREIYLSLSSAPSSLQGLIKRFVALEEDMRQHTHKENEILFPKALTF